MSGATVSINAKLPDGTLVQVGGVGYDDFYQNVLGAVGSVEQVDAVVEKVRAAITGTGPTQQQQHQQPASVTAAYTQPAASTPAVGGGSAPLCPTHESPAQWREGGISKTGNPYEGFWKCATTGNGIHLRGGQLKRSCG